MTWGTSKKKEKRVIRCKDCRFYGRAEPTISVKYQEPHSFNGDEPKSYFVEECWAGVYSCKHDSCFGEKVITSNPIEGEKITKIRIAGPAQFNANNNCHRFEKRTWVTRWNDSINY